MCDLATQAQAAVDTSDDCQDRHEAAHVRVPRVGQAVVQQGLGQRPGSWHAWSLPSVARCRGKPRRVKAQAPTPHACPPQPRAAARSRALTCALTSPRHWPSRCRARSRATVSSASVLLCVAVRDACGRARRLAAGSARQDRTEGLPGLLASGGAGARRGARPQPTSEQRRVRGAGGEQAAQEAEQLLHEARHVRRPLGQVPRRQHRAQQVHRQDLRETPRARQA